MLQNETIRSKVIKLIGDTINEYVFLLDPSRLHLEGLKQVVRTDPTDRISAAPLPTHDS